MTKNDGGPAFPATVTKRVFSQQAMDDANLPDALAFAAADCAGMTLRDYFAAAALTGIAGLSDADALTVDQAARFAYRYADEMLKARVK